MSKKIALLGSAPSSVRLAPYKDPSWTIWACSPGVYPTFGQERTFHEGDAWFELHRWEPPTIGDPTRQVAWFSPEYVQFLREFPGTVWMTEVVPDIPNSKRIPRETLLLKHGAFFFTSSLAWMAALALEDSELGELGFWGVDMAAKEEYRLQKPGCHFFITKAVERGIKITVPPESDLIQPQPLYGISEWDPMMIKLTARKRELESRIAQAQQRYAIAQQEVHFLQGAMDDMQYHLDTWVSSSEVEKLMLRYNIESAIKA